MGIPNSPTFAYMALSRAAQAIIDGLFASTVASAGTLVLNGLLGANGAGRRGLTRWGGRYRPTRAGGSDCTGSDGDQERGNRGERIPHGDHPLIAPRPDGFSHPSYLSLESHWHHESLWQPSEFVWYDSQLGPTPLGTFRTQKKGP